MTATTATLLILMAFAALLIGWLIVSELRALRAGLAGPELSDGRERIGYAAATA